MAREVAGCGTVVERRRKRSEVWRECVRGWLVYLIEVVRRRKE